MIPIEAMSQRLGGLAWIAGQISEIEQQWAPTLSSAQAVEHLATHGRHHAWHATLWTEALPDSPALESHQHIVSPSLGWTAALELAKDQIAMSDLQKLVTLYRGLLPRLVSELGSFSVLLEGPGAKAVRRIVGLVRPDITQDLHAGHTQLVNALGDPQTDEIVSSCTKALDQAFRT